MIAAWMAYTIVTGTLVAVACRLLEGIAQATRWPTRWIWLVGMTTMLAAGALSALSPRPAPLTSNATRVARVPSRPVGDGATNVSIASESVVARPSRLRDLEARFAAASGRWSSWDRPLLAAWALVAAFLAGVVAHAALEGRRLRHGLEGREVAGARVLLTEGIGPSAVGMRQSAILLPRWALDLDEGLLRLVVRHELEHVAARDPLLMLATLATVVLVPWHLPLWWSWRRLRLAVEVDCDARVLRAYPDVRRYAQLLLLAGQRAPAISWASQPMLSVVAPLRPHLSQLGRRITAMTAPHASRTPLRSALLAGGAVAALAIALALPLPRRVGAQAVVTTSATTRTTIDTVRVARSESGRVIVRTIESGLTIYAPGDPTLLVFASGPSRVSVDGDDFRALPPGDTLRFDRLPTLAMDVTDADVHVQLVTPGRLRLKTKVTGASGATGLGATMRHIIFKKGGNEVTGVKEQ